MKTVLFSHRSKIVRTPRREILRTNELFCPEATSTDQQFCSCETGAMEIANIVTSSAISDSNRAKFLYCSHFCEENVYKMAASIIDHMRSHRKHFSSASLFVIFISSECKRTPVWHQKAGIEGEPVLWDYHVVLVAKGISESLLREIFSAKPSDIICDQAKALSDCKLGQFKSEVESSQHPVMQIVFDLDTELPFPTDAKEYFMQSFRPEISLPSSYEQRFRVVPVEDFMDYFSSDRSHMKHSGAAFPSWPCIRGPKASSSMNLHEYIASKFDSGTISNKSNLGQMMSRERFGDWCSNDDAT